MKKYPLIVLVFIFFCTSLILLPLRQAVSIETNEEEDFYVANKAFEDGFYDLSLDIFGRFIKLYPGSSHLAEAQFSIGRCLFFQGKFLKALAQFQSLLSNPQASDFKDALLFWIAEVHFKGKDYHKAAQFYREIIENYPDSESAAVAHYSLGLCLFELENYEQAIDSFSQLISRFAKHQLVESAQFKIAESFYREQNYEQAKKNLKRFISSFSKSKRLPQGYFLLAEINFYSKDYSKALTSYHKVLELLKDARFFKGNEELKNLAVAGIGWAYLKGGNLDESREVFFAASESDTTLLGRAAIKIMDGKMDRAIEIYDELITRFPDSRYLFEASLGKAEVFYDSDSFPEAVRGYKQIIKRFSHLKNFKEAENKIYYGLAWSYLKSGSFQEAIKEFEKIALSSDDEIIKISALCQVGDTYHGIGQFDKAIIAYDKILKDYPDSLYSDYVQFQVAVSLYKSERLDAALVSFQAVLNNFPKTKLKSRTQYYLGLIYFQQGNYDGAVDVFSRLLKEDKGGNLTGDTLYLLATSFYNQGQYKRAITVFERILKENLKRDKKLSHAAEYEIANCLYQLGKEKEALAKFKTFLKRHPDSNISPDIIYWIGEYYITGENFEIARKYFRRLLNDYPGHELSNLALYNIAVSYLESERFRAALKTFSKIKDSQNIDLNFNAQMSMADIYTASREYTQALEIYDELIKDVNYSSYKALVLTKQADVLRIMRKFRQSLDAYQKAIELSSGETNLEILFKIAEVEEEIGNLKSALENFLKISYLSTGIPSRAQVGPSGPSKGGVLSAPQTSLSKQALLRAARICEAQNNWKEAKRIYNKLKDSEFQEAKYAFDRLNWIEKHIDNK